MEIYRGKRLTVVKEMCWTPDGDRERVIVNPGDAVAILPIHNNSCVLVKQYRPAIKQHIIEVPAGIIDEGETPYDAAVRELGEEIGFEGLKWIPRGFIYPSPGISTEKIYLFEAQGLVEREDMLSDEDGELKREYFGIDTLRSLALYGTISDAKTLALVLRCLFPQEYGPEYFISAFGAKIT